MTTSNPSNPDTRRVVDHWLDRMVDVEGTIHRNNGTVVLLISGKEINAEVPASLTPLDQIVQILDSNGVDLQPERVAAVRHWLQTAGVLSRA